MVKKTNKRKAAPAAEPVNPLFASRERNFRIGGDLQPKGDLYRFVRWPEYVRLQRQRRILLSRLKVPGPINQFRQTSDKGITNNLMLLLQKYKPESRVEKKARLSTATKEQPAAPPKPNVLKYGLKHITHLVENRKAKLVVIAHDVEPIELVLWLPALCRTKDVPYCIVKSKSALGKLIHKKTATAVALTEVRKEDVHDLELIVKSCRSKFNDNPAVHDPSEPRLGIKSQHRVEAQERLLAAENAKKSGL
jgi:large subunit ribosomal protein L7Ae